MYYNELSFAEFSRGKRQGGSRTVRTPYRKVERPLENILPSRSGSAYTTRQNYVKTPRRNTGVQKQRLSHIYKPKTYNTNPIVNSSPMVDTKSMLEPKTGFNLLTHLNKNKLAYGGLGVAGLGAGLYAMNRNKNRKKSRLF